MTVNEQSLDEFINLLVSRLKNGNSSVMGDSSFGTNAREGENDHERKERIRNLREAREEFEKLKKESKLTNEAINDFYEKLRNDADELAETESEFRQRLFEEGIGKTGSRLGNAWLREKRKLSDFGKGLNEIGASKNLGGIAKLGTTINKMAGPVGAAVAAIKLADKAFKACAEKAMEYQNLKLDNYIRNITAESQLYINSMQTGLTAWKNSIEGAQAALDLRIEGEFGVAKAAAETSLATQKFEHSLWNWVPVLGVLNKMSDQRKERMIKEVNAELEIAKSQLKIQQQYAKQVNDYAGLIDKTQREYQRMTGFTDRQMEGFRNNLYAATSEIAKFGKTQEDLIKSRMSFINTSGRNINWSAEDSVRSLAVGSLVGQDTMDQFAAGMVLFNTSVKDSASIMEQVYKDANKMGISSQKLTKSVLNNLKLAHRYNFRNGVEGFIKAAKWAETARYDMNSLGAALNKVQEGGLEGVLQQSAQLNVLGGNAAMGADPISMMYNAYNDPEAYARMQQNALKNFGHVSSATGETIFNMGDQMQIAAIAKAFGMSTEQGMEIARAANKRSALESVNGRLRGEDMDAVLNRAEYNKQNRTWEVKMADGTVRNVSTLTSSDINSLAPEDTRTAEDIARESLDTQQKTLAVTTQINNMLAASGGFADYIKFAEESNNATLEGMKTNADSILDMQKQSNEAQIEALKKSFDDMGTFRSVAENTADIKNMIEILNRTKLEKVAWKAYKDAFAKEAAMSLQTTMYGTILVPEQHLPKEQWRKQYYGGKYNSNELSDLAKGALASVNGKNGPADIVGGATGNVVNNNISNRTNVISGGEIGSTRMNSSNNTAPVTGNTVIYPYGRNNGTIKVEPVEIRLNGTLNLQSNGQKIDIIKELKSNPEMMKQLSQMISMEISKTINGGKSVAWNGRYGK